MLKPYVCVACEKVIFAADQVASLINLFSRMIINIPADSEIPRNAVAPKEWSIFSAWDVQPGDEARVYLICTQMLYPDQSQFGEVTKGRINIEANKSRAQFQVKLPAFPIAQAGPYTVRTWIEENNQTVYPPIEFKIELEVNRQEVAANESGQPSIAR